VIVTGAQNPVVRLAVADPRWRNRDSRDISHSTQLSWIALTSPPQRLERQPLNPPSLRTSSLSVSEPTSQETRDRLVRAQIFTGNIILRAIQAVMCTSAFNGGFCVEWLRGDSVATRQVNGRVFGQIRYPCFKRTRLLQRRQTEMHQSNPDQHHTRRNRCPNDSRPH